MADSIHRGGEEDPVKPEKTPKSVRLLATLALIIIGSGAGAGIAYSAIVDHDDASKNALVTISTLSVGAIVALAGGKHED